MKELQEKIEKFNEERDWDQFHSPENLAKSISIEAGELLECFQWNNEFDKKELIEELADVQAYCIMLAEKLDVDKHRKKGSLFKVREKTIGLIKEDWNYNKVEDSTIKQISSQIEPKKYNKLISDKKDDVILIQKYKGNYYNVPNDNNELETSED